MKQPTSAAAQPTETEYTIHQLAELSQITIRNIRAYQERGILSPPVKRGRIGIYNENHLTRLSIISQLLSRGYSIANIGEMLDAHQQGQDINQLIGLNDAVVNIWSEKNPVYLSMIELASRFKHAPTAEDIQYAFEVGVLEPTTGDQVKISDLSLLQLSAILIDYNFSFRQLLDMLVSLRQKLDEAAISIVDIGLSIILPTDNSTYSKLTNADDMTQLVRQLQPLLITIVDTELGNALSRNLKQKMTQRMTRQMLNHSNDSSK